MDKNKTCLKIPKFIMLVGLPGSGKSTYTKELSERYDATIHSSDSISEELSGDINNQNINDVVFKTLHQRVKNDLKNNNSCIYDATNISYKRRIGFLQELNNIPCNKICVIMATPYKTCLKNNQERNRRVPEDIIKKMYLNFDIAYYYEGWDKIEIKYAPGSQWSKGMPAIWCRFPYVKEFNQENSHHTLTLGKHCDKAGMYINNIYNGDSDHDIIMRISATLHDCGKPFTKDFHNSKGELIDEAHYFNHHKVGAYDSLFFAYKVDPLEVAIRVFWHMQPYFNKTDKLDDKYHKLWGDYLYRDIMLLHEADEYAH